VLTQNQHKKPQKLLPKKLHVKHRPYGNRNKLKLPDKKYNVKQMKPQDKLPKLNECYKNKLLLRNVKLTDWLEKHKQN
jgi:hypothetical protein